MSDVDSLVALAAGRESCPHLWRRHFTRLFADGVIRLRQPPAAEFALQLPAVPFAEDPLRAATFCAERIDAAHAFAQQVSIDFSCLAPADSVAWLGRFATALAGQSRTGAGFMISLPVEHPAAEALLTLRDSVIANRIRLAYRLRRHQSDSAPLPHLEQLLRCSHSDPAIELVPAGQRRLSLLHSREHDHCVLPLGLFQAPADTAWLMLDVAAARLGTPVEARRRISRILRFADNLLGELAWGRSALALDALMNRRVALHLSGLGDLLQSHGVLPDQPAGFIWLKRWLRFIRTCLVHESALLALQRGPFPGCGARELIAELTPRYGEQAARRLMRHRFLRHRHLLALSPFALFPTAGAAGPDARWIDLLPALACADVLTMRGSGLRHVLSLPAWGRLIHMANMLDAAHGAITHKRLR